MGSPSLVTDGVGPKSLCEKIGVRECDSFWTGQGLDDVLVMDPFLSRCRPRPFTTFRGLFRCSPRVREGRLVLLLLLYEGLGESIRRG